MNVDLAFIGAQPGFLEMFLIFGAVLLLFGADSLPKFARQFGRLMEELRRASQDFKDQVSRADIDLKDMTKDVWKADDSHMLGQGNDDYHHDDYNHDDYHHEDGHHDEYGADHYDLDGTLDSALDSASDSTSDSTTSEDHDAHYKDDHGEAALAEATVKHGAETIARDSLSSSGVDTVVDAVIDTVAQEGPELTGGAESVEATKGDSADGGDDAATGNVPQGT